MKRDHKAYVQEWRSTNHAPRTVPVRETNPVLPWLKLVGFALVLGIAVHQGYIYFQGVVG